MKHSKTICVHMQTYESHYVYTANLIDSLYTKTDIESLKINIYCFFDNQTCISNFCKQFPNQSSKIHCVSLTDITRNKLPSETVFNDPICRLDLNNPMIELEACESVDIRFGSKQLSRYLNTKRSYGIMYLQHLGYDFVWCLDSESLVLEKTSIKNMIKKHTDKPCLYVSNSNSLNGSSHFYAPIRLFGWKEVYPDIEVRHNDFWIISTSLFYNMITELITKHQKPLSYFMNGCIMLLYECYLYHQYKTLGQDIRVVQLPRSFFGNQFFRNVINDPEANILKHVKWMNDLYFNNTLSYRGDFMKWPEFETARGKEFLSNLNIKIAVSNWQGNEGWIKR